MKSKTDRPVADIYAQARDFFRKHYLPRWLVFLFDAGAVIASFIFAYFLRYNVEQAPVDLGFALHQSLIVLGIYCMFELLFRSFAGLIRHTTVNDISKVFFSSTLSLMLLVILTTLARNLAWTEFWNIPYSILVIHYVCLIAILFGMRIAIKMLYELLITSRAIIRKKVIIFGAGSMGSIVVKVIQSDAASDFSVVALFDNNKSIQSKDLGGIPVYSPKKLSAEFCRKRGITTMIFAIKDIPCDEKAEILKSAVDLGLEVLEVPAVHNWLNGQFNIDQLKKIDLEDLLHRKPIQLNMKAIASGLEGKTVMVTGGAGSIGSEIVRQLTRFSIREIILVDNAETPIFHIQNELKEVFPLAPVRSFLSDVTDAARMEELMRSHKPDLIFHAAAYKHVPMMEENPHQAIRVNVRGTMILTRLAQSYGVEKFVLVSTDKAVNPTSVMGASKRLCEMILQIRAEDNLNNVKFVITRFGNVLGSSGSVIPIFQKQILSGGPVTVTHPDITRFFMTIPEACQLVLEAGIMGRGGEIFVFDMGEPVKIDELARQMIRLSGYEPGRDIEVIYTGLRPGEKLFEETLAKQENLMPTHNPKVMVAEPAWINCQSVYREIHSLLASYKSISDSAVISRLRRLVPEFYPNNERYRISVDKEAILLSNKYSDVSQG